VFPRLAKAAMDKSGSTKSLLSQAATMIGISGVSPAVLGVVATLLRGLQLTTPLRNILYAPPPSERSERERGLAAAPTADANNRAGKKRAERAGAPTTARARNARKERKSARARQQPSEKETVGKSGRAHQPLTLARDANLLILRSLRSRLLLCTLRSPPLPP
jgi:hypothetical protein